MVDTKGIDELDNVQRLHGDEPPEFSPHTVARFLRTKGNYLRTGEKSLFKYLSNRWVGCQVNHIKTDIACIWSDSTARQRSETLCHLLEHENVQAEVGHFQWNRIGNNEVPLRDCVLDLGTGKTRPHDRGDFLDRVIDRVYDPLADQETWQGIVNGWFRNDEERDKKHDLLQEFFGYCLLPHNRYKKSLWCYGESNTGKSRVLVALEAVFGRHLCSGLMPTEMSSAVRLHELVGKMVNLIPELPERAKLADGGFKAVTAGDIISINPKYRDPMPYVPTAKHVICTNNLPEITDMTKGTFERLLLVPFNYEIPITEQNKNIDDVIHKCADGILTWAVEGARRLLRNGGMFTIPEESREAVEEYRRDENKLSHFIKTHCSTTDHMVEMVTCEELRVAYNEWSGKDIVTPQYIGKALVSLGYTTSERKERHRTDTTKRRTVRYVVGLALAKPEQFEIEPLCDQ